MPEQTVLFLGAGASIPSGAPSGASLATTLVSTLTPGKDQSGDLMEIASILENRFDRKRVIDVIRKTLANLKPGGGLAAIPSYAWAGIYSTNFDRLVEIAYANAKKPLTVIRSNFEYGKTEASAGVVLYKLHGCISQDTTDGAKTGMTLTDSDYEEHREYREVLFRKLESDVTTKDVLIIGQSLRDPHLKRIIEETTKLHQKKGTAGKVFLLSYERDEDRASLWEKKGIRVASGSIDEFIEHLSGKVAKPTETAVVINAEGIQLPTALLAATTDVSVAQQRPASAIKLFNGRPGTFADIHAGLTFPRTVEASVIDDLSSSTGKPFHVVLGVAGVGKTTFARRILTELQRKGFQAWEHRGDFQLKDQEWVRVASALAKAGKPGVLLIDDCTSFLGRINAFVASLAKLPGNPLRVLLTSTTNQWVNRIKDPALFRLGVVTKLSALSSGDIDALLTLLEQKAEIKACVGGSFSNLSRLEQREQLRNRCRADMYVCLKNIFGNDDLDSIILREYAELPGELQDVYRHVSALEASGARVNRHLVIKVLGLPADKILAMLNQLEGLVEEYDIDQKSGIYGWATRHQIIAQTISKFKFSEQIEIESLIERVIETINPLVPLELRTLRDICSSDYGAYRISDDAARIRIYRKMIDLAPGERVPRHRLIRTLLRRGENEEAAQEIRQFEELLGYDSPINTFKIRLAIQRSQMLAGIQARDRLAILREGCTVALRGIARIPDDKHAYKGYADLGVEIAEKHGQLDVLDDAIARIRSVIERILDPQLSDELSELERKRSKFH